MANSTIKLESQFDEYNVSSGSTLTIVPKWSSYALVFIPTEGDQCRVYIGAGYGPGALRHKISMILGTASDRYEVSAGDDKYSIVVKNNGTANLKFRLMRLGQ